jgi:hypothetical protein
VIHFEVVGKDGDKLRSYYSELFGWEFSEPLGPTNYAVVQVDPENTGIDGDGIPGGIGTAPKIPEVNIEIGLFTDPEGHVIGVVKPQAQG